MADLAQTMLYAVEAELHRVVEQPFRPGYEEMHHMLAYQLGWEGKGAGPEARGKRIRPLLVLLSTAAAGGAWEDALPAAAAVELLHNFSLVHDDIQDQSDLRRGRPTIWKLWGIAQAINAGDALFTLSYLALHDLSQTPARPAALAAGKVFGQACFALTQGQYLDLHYEARGDLSLEAYWPMVSGKTAALLSACCELGALAASAPEETIRAYANFGQNLGLAFQALDDLLGIWGDEALTGKSSASDLLTGKKSLPVLYALAHSEPFAGRWAQGSRTVEDLPELVALLEASGAHHYTRQRADELTSQALQALQAAHPQGEAGQLLHALALQLLQRQA